MGQAAAPFLLASVLPTEPTLCHFSISTSGQEEERDIDSEKSEYFSTVFLKLIVNFWCDPSLCGLNLQCVFKTCNIFIGHLYVDGK
jgi:hypothetical protein